MIERLNAEFNRASASSRGREIYAENAAETLTMTPPALQQWLEREVKTWAGVVRATGLKLQ